MTTTITILLIILAIVLIIGFFPMFAGLLIVPVGILLFIAILSPVFKYSTDTKRERCTELYSAFGKTDFSRGVCRVEQNGQWIPAENLLITIIPQQD